MSSDETTSWGSSPSELEFLTRAQKDDIENRKRYQLDTFYYHRSIEIKVDGSCIDPKITRTLRQWKKTGARKK